MTRIRLIGILLFILLFACAGTLAAQTTTPKGELGLPFITSYSQRDYGAAADNWSVIQDQRGIVYIGNQWGVLEFDGVNWRFIPTSTYTYVRSFAVSEDGRVYVGMSGDIGYLAPDSVGRTTIVSLLDDVPEDFRTFADVWDTFVMDDGVYFSTAQGLIRWRDGDVKIWRGSHHVSSVVNGVLYIREFGVGLLRLEGDELKLVPGGERFADERIYAYVPYDKDRMLIGTRTQGFFLFDGETFTPFKTEADAYLAANQIYLPGARLRDGTFLFGTISGGLVQIDSNGHLIRILNTESGLPDNTVAYICEDREGGVWLALGRGVAYVDFGSPFTVFDRRSGINSPPFTMARYNGRLYAGGLAGAIVLNPKTGQLESVGRDPLPSLDLLRFDNVLLSAAMTSGVVQIRGDGSEIIRPADNNLNVGNSLARSRKDSTVAYLALRGGFGAIKRLPTGRWEDLGRIDLQGESSSIEIDEQEYVWVGSSNRGAYRIEIPVESGTPALQDAKVRHYGPDNGLPAHGTHVHRLGEKILASTPSGIFRYSRGDDRFVPDHSIPATRFSPAEEAHVIVEDTTNGTAWAEFGYEPFRGVRRPDGSYEWEPFLTNELGGENIGAILPEGDVVWFATLDGIVRYDASRESRKVTVPAPSLRSVTLRNDSLLYGGLPPGDAPLEATLGPDDTSIEIAYASPSYTGRLTYATLLEGLDGEWSDWGTATKKSYTNLQPGDYRFRVRTRNLSGTLSDETAYSFSIQPHWYVTWWAYLGYVLVGIGLVGGFVRIRTGQLKSRQRELERTVEERTTEIRQRVEELGVINSVQQGLVAEMDMQGIYELVGERIRDLFDAQVVVIRTFDHENKLEIFEYVTEKGERFTDLPPRVSDGFGLHLASLREPLLLNEGFAEYVQQFSTGGPFAGEPPKAAVFVPLIVGDQVKGNISLQNVDREHAFTDSDVRLLTTLANSMSVALENARLFDQTNKLLAEADQRATEMATVNRISQALVSQLEFDALVKLVGEQIQQTFQADMAYVAFLDKEENVINFPYGYGDDFPPMEFGEGFTSQIIRTGDPLLVNEDVGGRFEELGLKEIGKRSASYLGVPISVGGEVVGVVSVQSTQATGRFNDDDLHLLSTIAANVGIALQNAEAYRQLNETLKNLKSTQEQLVTQEKMASLGQLTAGIAHEIKNPLNFVNNFAELNAELAAEAGEMFDRHRSEIPDELAAELIPMLTGISVNAQQIHKHGKRADGIVKNMMQHATGTSSERYRVEVNPLVDEYVGLAFHGMKAQVPDLEASVRKDFDPSVGIAQLSPQEMGRVMLNLVNNALYAVHEKSQQVNGEYKPTVTVRTRKLADAIEIRVADNGKGIPANIRDRIFEPLFTTKPTGSGTGLGLSLSFDIVTQGHGGSMRVESEEGEGAEFVVTIPLR